jgi:glycosyltransferase involved in cell wall biosynthesis
MPKRIVFHIASLRGGGAERVFVLMANELAARGHDVTLLTWNGQGPNAALISDMVKLEDFDFPLRGESYGKATTLKGLLRTARTLRDLDPDAVFSAPEFANLIVAVALAIGRSRARFFPTFHAATSLVAGRRGARAAVWLSALVARRATKAVAVSSGIGRELESRGFARSKIAVIHNPLLRDTGIREQSYAWQRELNAMEGGPVVITVGRLVPIKDHRTLIGAFAILRRSRPARLVIFGEGPLAEELLAFAEKSGVGQDVLFAGYVNDPVACYAAADLFVLSSTSEGFGNVLVEAMAAGVPVVSTDAPYGPREILDDGRFGSLVPVGDAPALANEMTKMLDRPTDAVILKDRAAKFDVAAIGDLYEALLGT